MWLETLSKAIKDIKDIMDDIPNVESIKELNKTELKVHNIFQEYYGVLGNVTREVKQAIRAQKMTIKRNEVEKRAIEQEKALERLLEETPEQEIIDTTKMDDVVAMNLNGNIVTDAPELTDKQKQELEEIKEEVKAKKTTQKKKTTKRKTTKKADK